MIWEVDNLYSEYSIKSVNTHIVLSVWDAETPAGAIVFIPATMVHPLFYESLLKGFSSRGFSVIGVHPVGHGKSPRNINRYTISDIVQNGRDAVSFALDRYSLPVIVMGSSQGGIVASAIAATDTRIAAVFAHNLLLSELPDSIGVSRFPKWLRHVYGPVQSIFKIFAKLVPDLQLPLGFYLEPKRISTDQTIWDTVLSDELNLSRYSLHFLASLFTTHFPGLTDGSVRCPFYVVADRGDQLFTEDYMNQVFERLKAPYKEIILFDFGDHMLMVKHPQDVCDRLIEAMRKVSEHTCTKS